LTPQVFNPSARHLQQFNPFSPVIPSIKSLQPNVSSNPVHFGTLLQVFKPFSAIFPLVTSKSAHISKKAQNTPIFATKKQPLSHHIGFIIFSVIQATRPQK